MSWARKALRTRAVGHAGTLDPMATGVLVLAVGEGTKLVRWLTADDKAYRATVALGAETDTLDAEGEIVARREPTEPVDLERAQEVARRFVGTFTQTPPIYSAIKVGGRALHTRARRGEEVTAPEREVTVRRLRILEADRAHLALEVEAAKGFYVRSLGRDLARSLGTLGHLSELRRTRSGSFELAEAVDGEELRRLARSPEDEPARERLRAALLPLADACRGMPRLPLAARGTADAAHGRPVRLEDAAGAGQLVEDAEPIALLGPGGELVAVAARRGETLRVLRGFGGGRA